MKYAKRRLLPPLSHDADETVPHTVSAGERADQLGQRYFGDSGQWWRVADANPVLAPDELTDEPGEQIAVPLPGGFSGGMGGPGVRNG
ncbi:LysM domain-containing protein [Streptomyces purpurogeneiscleroticus]|uniref:LysM domain-containing protein n=1 Tax=Streptomyces purpurogeneiscleroticus TaxID=68259 RepID=UPI0027DFC74A|nr:LysM domain-containing protein [Streptomyces purpurogeneiscleroticus]